MNGLLHREADNIGVRSLSLKILAVDHQALLSLLFVNEPSDGIGQVLVILAVESCGKLVAGINVAGAGVGTIP